MDTVIVASSQFYSHYPKRIPKGTVNAEAVLIRLDSEWEGLTVRIHWLNVASKVEKNPLMERDKPNTIPWEVLADLGELRMGLVGLDGETVIKPTIWITYGHVVDGVDPESGSDPQPPTPSWEQQMVEQAKAAAAAAEASKDAAEKAGEAAGAAAPYADEAKKSAEEAKASQDAAATSVQEAWNAKDQANIASNTAKGHADAAGTAKVAAERSAETAGNAQSGAAQSAQAAANSAQAAERAKQEAQNAAAAFPAPSPEVAGMVPMVNPEGDGYVFGDVSSGVAGEWELVADVTIEEEITKLQIDKNQDGIPFRYTEMYFLFTLITNDSPGEFWVNNSNTLLTPTKNTTNNLYGFLMVHNNVTLISVRGTNAVLATNYGSYMYHSLRKESEITQFLLTNIRAQAGSTLQVYGR